MPQQCHACVCFVIGCNLSSSLAASLALTRCEPLAQVDYLMNGLVMLKEHVDDTEDLINIELDNRCLPSLAQVLLELQVLQQLLLCPCCILQGQSQSLKMHAITGKQVKSSAFALPVKSCCYQASWLALCCGGTCTVTAHKASQHA